MGAKFDVQGLWVSLITCLASLAVAAALTLVFLYVIN